LYHIIYLKAIKIKLKKLMKELQLVSGSFDIIVTKTGEYIFLEVNPIGQFSQVSIPCNYYLEKRIALYL
jgi:D-alanine-D-alanine ligase-like ATP-grasp enzyme